MQTIKKNFLTFLILFSINGLYAQLSIFDVKAPNNLAGTYLFGRSIGFGKSLDSVQITANLIVMRSAGAIDSVGANTASNNVNGKIAVIYRGGGISFSVKAKNAESSGAVGCIIINKFNGVDNTFTPDQYFDMPTTGDVVNIPVIMISENTGKLLRSAIDAGTLNAFMGKQTGYFDNDLSLSVKDVMHLDGVMPSRFTTGKNFQYYLGANVLNIGKTTQKNVNLNIKIQSNNTVYYTTDITHDSIQANNTAILGNESNYLNLSTFPSGYYSIVYTINSSTTDQYLIDNTITSNFWITDSLSFSKGKFDQAYTTLFPSGYYGTSSQKISWCSLLASPDYIYDGLSVSSITTNTFPTTGVSLIGKTISAELYEWNDTLTTAKTAKYINLVASNSYTFTANDGKNIKIPFTNAYTLQNGKKYLACINKNAQLDVWLGTDNVALNFNDLGTGRRGVNSVLLFNDVPYINNVNKTVPALTVNMKDCNCSPSQTDFTLNDYHRVTSQQITTVTLPSTCVPDLKQLTGGSWLSYTYGFANNNVTLNVTTTDNTIPTPRVATISINGKVFTITQPGTGCVYSLSNFKYTCSDEKASAYGNISTVSTTNNCTWTTWTAQVTSGNSWLSTTSSATGNGPISINVAENTGDCPRTGTISVYGTILTIEQPGKNNNLGCAYSKSNWILEDSKLSSVHKSIFAIEPTSATNVWAIARDTNAYTRTLDGGLNWTNSTITGADNYKFSNISALNKDTAWVAMYLKTNSTGDLFYTHNGGTTWSKSDPTMFKNSSSFPNLVHFFNANNGVTVGDPVNGNFELYITTDAGQNWTPLNIPFAIIGEAGISNTFAHIGDTIWFTTNKGRIFRSTDKGYNWTVNQLPYSTYIESIAFKDALNGISTLANGIYRTTDGGNNWTILTPASGYLYANQGANLKYVKGTGDVEGRYVGASTNYKNTSVYSVDNGDNWVHLDTLYHSAFGFWDAKTGWTGATPTWPLSTKSTIYGLTVCNPAAPTTYTKLSAPNSAVKLADSLKICKNSSYSITANGAGKLSWYSSNVKGNLLSNSAQLVSASQNNGGNDYTVYVQDSTCYLSKRTALKVHINAIPVVTAAVNKNNICAGESVIFKGNGAVSYVWDNNVIDNVSTSVSTSKTYHLTGTDLNGCENKDSVVLTVKSLPISTTTVTSKTIESNQQNAVYQWVNCGTNLGVISSATTQSFIPSTSGEYAVIVSENGCSDTSACVKFSIAGLNKISANEFNIYPNPSTGAFTISGAKIGSYAITNEVGAVVFEFTVSENANQSFTIDQLSNGIYFLNGTNGTILSSHKIVVID